LRRSGNQCRRLKQRLSSASFKKSLGGGPGSHGPGGTGRDADFAHAAFGFVKFHSHLRAHNIERRRGANRRASSALGTFVRISFDFLRGVLNLYPPEILKT
jgi:50S ribosomal subunit-associated GTPase HflX